MNLRENLALIAKSMVLLYAGLVAYVLLLKLVN